MEKTVERKNYTYPETLCWFCGNYLDGCSWARSFEPVPGWTATPTRKNGDDSFFVYACPEYIPDRAAEEAGRPRTITVPNEGFSNGSREMFLQGMRRSRSRKYRAGAKRFLTALDRGETVANAATKAEISLSTAYVWLRILRGETPR